MAFWYLRNDGVSRQECEQEAVVLSPSLYWYAHAKFPTRSLAKARRLADAFLDTRPDNYRTLFVQRTEEGYDCYAYDAEEVREKMEEAGIPAAAPIWFLQQFISQMPLRLDDTRIAETIHGIAVEIPDLSRALPSLVSLDLYAVAPPINREKEGAIGKGLTALTIAIAIAVSLDLGMRLQEYTALQRAVEKSRTDRSLYEIRSLVKRYEKIASQQQRLREQIAETLRKARGLKRLRCTPEEGCRSE